MDSFGHGENIDRQFFPDAFLELGGHEQFYGRVVGRLQGTGGVEGEGGRGVQGSGGEAQAGEVGG